MKYSCFLLLMLLSAARAEPPPAPAVGAIRWDAWYGQTGPVKAVEKTLAPPKYRWRMPWFAKVVNGEEVSIDGDRQEVIEQEIAWAAQAGLSYWAFLDYGPGDPMTRALDRYLAAPEKRGVRYCLIEEGSRIDGRGGARDWPRLVRHFQQPDYLKVLGGRPVLYVFQKPVRTERAAFEELRAQCLAAGLSAPYLVLMGWNPAHDVKDMRPLGFDAVSAYAAGSGYTMKPQPYAALAAGIRKDRWEKCAEEQIPCVTFATAGWDTRPRNERPPPWVKWIGAGTPDPTPFAEQKPLRDEADATRAELAAHFREALAWTVQHPAVNPSQLVIIYGWNENDEGGWLIPTLGVDGTPDEEHLQALREALHPTAGER